MGFIAEFRQFAMRGNVIDLAVGVVIGSAFGKIISSMVDDIITPMILIPALKAAHLAELSQLVIPGTAIKYGNFISQIISFTLIAFSLFVFVKAVNRMQKKPPVIAETREEILLKEIRDAIREKRQGL